MLESETKPKLIRDKILALGKFDWSSTNEIQRRVCKKFNDYHQNGAIINALNQLIERGKAEKKVVNHKVIYFRTKLEVSE